MNADIVDILLPPALASALENAQAILDQRVEHHRAALDANPDANPATLDLDVRALFTLFRIRKTAAQFAARFPESFPPPSDPPAGHTGEDGPAPADPDPDPDSDPDLPDASHASDASHSSDSSHLSHPSHFPSPPATFSAHPTPPLECGGLPPPSCAELAPRGSTEDRDDASQSRPPRVRSAHPSPSTHHPPADRTNCHERQSPGTPSSSSARLAIDPISLAPAGPDGSPSASLAQPVSRPLAFVRHNLTLRPRTSLLRIAQIAASVPPWDRRVPLGTPRNRPDIVGVGRAAPPSAFLVRPVSRRPLAFVRHSLPPPAYPRCPLPSPIRVLSRLLGFVWIARFIRAARIQQRLLGALAPWRFCVNLCFPPPSGRTRAAVDSLLAPWLVRGETPRPCLPAPRSCARLVALPLGLARPGFLSLRWPLALRPP